MVPPIHAGRPMRMASSTIISPGKKRGPPASGSLMRTCCSVGVHGGGFSPYERQLELAPYPNPNNPKPKMPKNNMIPEMVPFSKSALCYNLAARRTAQRALPSPLGRMERRTGSRGMPDSRRRIAVLGSTGSIGRQTLDVVRAFPDHFQIVALVARSNVALLAEQAREFAPALVGCTDDSPSTPAQLEALLPCAQLGLAALTAAATHPDVEIVVAATSGLVGVEPVLAAIRAGKTIALANKETLVMAGHLVMPAARRRGVEIRPVDSEHSALWQCLHGERAAEVRRLIITASGGPFRQTPLADMAEC